MNLAKSAFGAVIAAGALCGGAAQAAQVTIDLTNPTTIWGDPLAFEIDLSAQLTALGYNAGSLRIEGSIPGASLVVNPRILRNEHGLGLCESYITTPFGSGCVDPQTVDGASLVGANETVKFTVTGQESGFEFVLVSATFGHIDDLLDISLLDNVRLAVGSNAPVEIDIAHEGTCVNQFSGLCTVNFVDYFGDLPMADSFTFSATEAGDGWYIRSIVWEIPDANVPEPAALGLLGLGLAGLGLARRRRG